MEASQVAQLVENLPANAENTLEEGNGNPLPYPSLKSTDREPSGLQSRCCKQSDATEVLHRHTYNR